MARLLIVDDDISFTQKLMHELKKNGFESTALNTGQGVIEFLKKDPVPVVILDVMLPKNSGFELCREIRIDRDIYHKGIILVSVMGDKEEIEHGYAQGCDDYISKPVHLGNFLTRLKSIFDLVENDKLVEPITTLGSGRYIRLEILRGILLKESFDLAYIELLGIFSMQRQMGDEGIIKLLRMFSHHLRSLSATYLGKDYYLAHLGGGHFIAKFRSGSLKDIAVELKNSWEDIITKSENVYLSAGDKLSSNESKRFGVMVCGFTHSSADSENINTVLGRLRNLYSRCKSNSPDGILIDRRT
ncbi:MAG: response regulator [Candidatus Hydrogenedentes bacterium]|nr:response regulator [Candidatus Hydrogenedentota bacterium]